MFKKKKIPTAKTSTTIAAIATLDELLLSSAMSPPSETEFGVDIERSTECADIRAMRRAFFGEGIFRDGRAPSHSPRVVLTRVRTRRGQLERRARIASTRVSEGGRPAFRVHPSPRSVMGRRDVAR